MNLRFRRATALVTVFAYSLTLASSALAEGTPTDEAAPVNEGEATEAVALAESDSGSGEAAPSTADVASIEINSTGDAVTVARITERMTATGAAGGTVVTIAGVAWKDLCISPCKIELEPGLHELMIYGDGVTGATNKFDLKAGTHHLRVDPGSSALSTGGVWLTAFGIVAIVMGGTLYLVSSPDTRYNADGTTTETESSTQKLATPLLLGGVLGTGVGIGMIYAGATTFEREPGPTAPSSPSSANTPFGLSYRGTM
jgi:hypothetical protein